MFELGDKFKKDPDCKQERTQNVLHAEREKSSNFCWLGNEAKNCQCKIQCFLVTHS